MIHQLGLNQAAEYLEMASRLVRLKAQMLLPRSQDGEGWDDPRAELEREGVLNTRPGLGVFVAEPQADLSAAARRHR